MVKHYQGAPGLCKHKDNSILWERSDELQMILEENKASNGDLFKKIGQRAQTFARNGLNSHIDRYSKYFNQLFELPYSQENVIALQIIAASRSISFRQYTNIPEVICSKYFDQKSKLELPKFDKKPLRYRIIDYVWFNIIKNLTPRPVKSVLNFLRRKAFA